MPTTSLTPIIPSPLSDFLFLLAPQYKNNQSDPICVKIESKLLDCLDAYGSLKARIKCADLIYDMAECSTQYAQKDRVHQMVKERMKQYRQGKLAKPFEEHPPLDSLMSLPR